MKILIFNGSIDRNELSTSYIISGYLADQIRKAGAEPVLFHLSDAGIPFIDLTLNEVPRSVRRMTEMFTCTNIHIWLTPLYHGGMTGAMKNCLDWLEITAREPRPYLSNQLIGLVSWADGGKAMLGIQSMEIVAKSLRAWVHPYSIPLVRSTIFQRQEKIVAEEIQEKLNKMIVFLLSGSEKLHQGT